MDRTYPLLPVEFDATEQRIHDYVRHGATNLFAALNLSTGEVIGDCVPRRNGPAFLAFLKKASLRTPAVRSMWCWTTCPPKASFRCSRGGRCQELLQQLACSVGRNWLRYRKISASSGSVARMPTYPSGRMMSRVSPLML